MAKKTPQKVYWLIWSNEHDGWWKPNECGYAQKIKEAGRYTYHKARAICRSANYGKYDRPNETMVQDYVGIKN